MGALHNDQPTSKNKLVRLFRPNNIQSNGLKRTIAGLSLVIYFGIAVYVGLPLILLTTLIIQMKCFDEIINIAYTAKRISDVPRFRALNWYLVVVANYFFSGEFFSRHFEVYIRKYWLLYLLMSYHRFISFCCYLAGIIFFLTSLRRNVIRQQFTLLAWTHFLLIIISGQSFMIVGNVFEGLIWLVVPFALVILNDVSAYVFGKLLGKTPLINLSPKKTVEGFIGGGIATVVLSVLLSKLLCKSDYFVCPIVFVDVGDTIITNTNCTRNHLFREYNYNFGQFSLVAYPFIFHTIAFALFASLVAPFGGFCASGFKRAFNVKDFGDVIPGHGGLMDRFDCQYLMATFVNVYVSSFVRTPSVEGIIRKVLFLRTEEQVKFYLLLKEFLMGSDLESGSKNNKFL